LIQPFLCKFVRSRQWRRGQLLGLGKAIPQAELRPSFLLGFLLDPETKAVIPIAMKHWFR
jgi:hypothetical protein